MNNHLIDFNKVINLSTALSSSVYGSLNPLTQDGHIRNVLKSRRRYIEASIKGISGILEALGSASLEQLNMNILYPLKAAHLQYIQFDKLLSEVWPEDYLFVQKSGIVDELMQRCDQLNAYHKADVSRIIKNMLTELPKKLVFIARHKAAWKYLLQGARCLAIDLAKASEVQIKRSINFPPELKQAGMSILGYFSHILSVKYPNMDVSVTIEQTDNKVTLIIDSPEGEYERIEKDLSTYGLIVIGNMSPEELLHDPLEILRLKQKLEIAALELRQTKELLHSERQQYNARIDQLEVTTKNIWMLLDKKEYEKKELLSAFMELNSHANDMAKEYLHSMMEYIEKDSVENEKKNIQVLIDKIQRDDKTLFDYIQELVIKGSLQGAAGNFLYSFFQSVGWTIR